MLTFTIPLKKDPNSGAQGDAATYEVKVSSLYQAYGATLKNYPVADGHTVDSKVSQEKRGLQTDDRSGQNTAWKAQKSFGMAQGTGQLNRYSITYPFASIIQTLDAGNMRFGLLLNLVSNPQLLTFDETNKVMDGITESPGFAVVEQRQCYMTTSPGGSYFILAGHGTDLRVTPCDVNGAATAAPVVTAIDNHVIDSDHQNGKSYVCGCNGSSVFVVYVCPNSVTTQYTAAGTTIIKYQIYSLQNDGTLVFVDDEVETSQNNTTSHRYPYRYMGVGSYVKNNTAYVVAAGAGLRGHNGNTTIRTGSRLMQIFSWDLTNATTVTRTIYKEYDELINGSGGSPSNRYGINAMDVITGLDGANIVRSDSSKNIYQSTPGGTVTDTGSDIFLSNYYTLASYHEGISKLTTDVENNYLGSSNIYVKATAINGTKTSIKDFCSFIYGPVGTSSQDDEFKGIILIPDTGKMSYLDESIDLKVQGNVIATEILPQAINGSGTLFSNVTISSIVVNDSYIEFEIVYANPNGFDAKIGFGITGGTYDSPTGNYETSSVSLTL